MKNAIKVENLSKRYRIGMKEELHDTFVGSLVSWVKSPLSNFRQVQELSKFDKNGDTGNSIWAIKDVSFEVEQGQVLGIIGGNGAGKSTLLKILAGITKPTEGRAVINGRIGSLLEVGTGFHPELTGRENLYLGGTILGMKKIEIDNKCDEIIDFSGIEKFIDTPVKRYSSGMRIRLAFSVAAHLEPEILLIDEVLAVGDIDFQKKCLGKMDNLSKGGRTVVFVSHNLLAVNDLCSNGILLENGRILIYDKVENAIKYYMEGRVKRGVGEHIWEEEKAPGDNRIKLKAIRIKSEGSITNTPSLENEIDIEIDYWNYIDNMGLLVGVHLINSTGVTVFTSANFEGASLIRDNWFYKNYPKGLFRTICKIPAFLLNEGIYTVHLYINKKLDWAVILGQKDVIGFRVKDSFEMRRDYTGKWTGVIRPKLGWFTEKID